ncbi:uncharacterized protein Z519_06659 [Cladophialophora bantiana CBS 173.52]|uniref:Choline monooxygenase, chloroplastic n=1 Tax=Cladophialophora bantiana (strain ATCC 10958 / CBS 173.52 / CDC B-1940 / NIH 8579) TaxID=1442370 RepID=A0A0D2HPM9_CLAB1|nr:uncharacterized protein Z519_06659 [Cladophialophora bantiana CBS 173.52]KIW92810.1 hypothetical protein Z519_06659 [Cladophialophora bantiana CBS 173.52]
MLEAPHDGIADPNATDFTDGIKMTKPILEGNLPASCKLTKAPKFEELQDFNREDYSLFEIHTHIDKVGFVYSVEPHSGRLEHFPTNRDDIKPEDFEYFSNGAFTYNYPNFSVNLSTLYFFIMRVILAGHNTVITEYQTFRSPASTQDTFQRSADFFEGIELEDYDLVNGVQRSLDSGVYVHGPLHTTREGGVLSFKKLVRQQLNDHVKLEAATSRKIWPAERNQQLHAAVGKEEKFCSVVCECARRKNV